jgi:predicted acetyltransferase
MDALQFRPLALMDEDAVIDAQRIMAQEDFVFAFDYQPGQDFRVYLAQLEDQRHGRNLRPGGVPASFELAVVEGRIAGRLSVRHTLNEVLLQRGGHVGYCVLPAFRRRGVGSACMRRGLALASSLGIESVLVTCDENNIASRRIIEQAGGRYESSDTSSTSAKPVRRYWFEREAQPSAAR